MGGRVPDPDLAEVLNIGAGCNLSGALDPVRRPAGRVVGVDPDESIWENPHLDERHQASLEEFALDHAGEFDVALAVFVLEHVADPQAFTAACARTLRPGGLFFALTVHKYQYFGLTTWATTRLHVNDWLLRAPQARGCRGRLSLPDRVPDELPGAVQPTPARSGLPVRRVPDVRQAGPLRVVPAGHRSSRSHRPGRRFAYRLNTPWLMGTLSFRAVR